MIALSGVQTNKQASAGATSVSLESDKFPGEIPPCSLVNIICPRFVLALKVFLAQDWVQSGLRFSFVHSAAIAMQPGAAPDFPSLTKAGCLFHYNLNTP